MLFWHSIFHALLLDHLQTVFGFVRDSSWLVQVLFYWSQSNCFLWVAKYPSLVLFILVYHRVRYWVLYFSLCVFIYDHCESLLMYLWDWMSNNFLCLNSPKTEVMLTTQTAKKIYFETLEQKYPSSHLWCVFICAFCAECS